MSNPHDKYVSYRGLTPGQMVSGVKHGQSSSGFRATVVKADAGSVVLNVFGTHEETYPSDALFVVKMSDDEFQAKYRKRAKEVMSALCNRLASYEIGYHEMWNSWLDIDPYEMAANCDRHNLKVLGYCQDIPYKAAMFSGEHLDIGICVEDEDGDKFWCHYKSDWLRQTFDVFHEIAPENSPWAGKGTNAGD